MNSGAASPRPNVGGAHVDDQIELKRSEAIIRGITEAVTSDLSLGRHSVLPACQINPLFNFQVFNF